MKICLFLAFNFASLALFAQTNMTSTDLNQTLGRNKVKPWSLEFLIASEQYKDIVTKRIDGQYSKMDVSLLRGLSNNDEMRFYLSSRYITNEDSPSENEFDWFFTELMYRRRNLLTEADHGVSMEFEFKNLYYLDPEIREQYGFNGATIPQISFNKRIGKFGSTELRLRRHFNHNNNNDDYTVREEDRAYLSYAQYIPHGKLAYIQAKYQHKYRKDDGLDWRYSELIEMVPIPYTNMIRPDFSKVPEAKKEQEIVTIHPSLMLFLNRQNLMEIYYETKLSNTYDKRDMATIMNDESVFGVAFYLTAF